VFREYDIRGRIDREDELTRDAAYRINRGFAVFLKRRGITDAVVACDARPYSKDIKESVIKALRDSGIGVIDIGVVLVPIFYFSQYHLRQKGGVMITASHNPWGWTGFKHAYDYSTTFVPEDMAELKKIVDEEGFSDGKGGYTAIPDIIADYTADVLARVSITRRLRVVVDTGNGTAGPIVPAILRAAGCDVVEQYTEPGAIRHHEANPSTMGMLDAIADGVKKHKADIGLGFDDDGDRIGAVDEWGQIIWPDRMLALMSRPVLAASPGAKIVFDVKCSEALVEDIRAHDGVPLMWKTGHSYIKAKSKEADAALAGERSGHIFFRRGYYGFDDATFAALKLLEYVGGQSLPVSELVAGLPRYITSPVWHAPCADEEKYKVVDALVEGFKREYGDDKVIDINGGRVYLEDGWGLVRASSNVPALVLVFEAKTPEGLQRIETAFRKKLTSFSGVGSEWSSG
jgi:phosphomannomutase/phosphoglucomutase